MPDLNKKGFSEGAYLIVETGFAKVRSGQTELSSSLVPAVRPSNSACPSPIVKPAGPGEQTLRPKSCYLVRGQEPWGLSVKEPG